MKCPSDREILQTIYDMYYEEFQNYVTGATQGRRTKVFVPVDCKRVAKKLAVDGDIVFGRLYYALQEKYGYTKNDGKTNVAFFEQIPPDGWCINFPLMASVLAGLQEDFNRSQRTWRTAFAAIVISLASSCFTAQQYFFPKSAAAKNESAALQQSVPAEGKIKVEAVKTPEPLNDVRDGLLQPPAKEK